MSLHDLFKYPNGTRVSYDGERMEMVASENPWSILGRLAAMCREGGDEASAEEYERRKAECEAAEARNYAPPPTSSASANASPSSTPSDGDSKQFEPFGGPPNPECSYCKGEGVIWEFGGPREGEPCWCREEIRQSEEG